jgi:hypothetical protein
MNVAISRRLTVLAVLAALAGASIPSGVLASTEPAALRWTTPLDVRAERGVELADADFSAAKVAVAWEVSGGGSRKVGLRTSIDGGASFGSPSITSGARQAAVELCGSKVEAVYARKVGSEWGIERAAGSASSGGYVRDLIGPASGVARYPDVACAGGRVFVSWYLKQPSGDKLFVSHGRRADGVFELPQELGLDDETFFGRSLAVAGVNDTALVVYTLSDGDLRLRRWLVGAGPDFPVSAPVDQVLTNATPGDSASSAVIASERDKVAVAWFRCDGIYARVSNDRGLTWGPKRSILSHAACDGDFGASPRSIAVRGSRIVVTYSAFSLTDGWDGIISTTNDFASFSDKRIWTRRSDEHMVGFVKAAGATRLAAALDTGDRVRFRRER